MISSVGKEGRSDNDEKMKMIVVRGHIREFHDMIQALLCLDLRAQYS